MVASSFTDRSGCSTSDLDASRGRPAGWALQWLNRIGGMHQVATSMAMRHQPGMYQSFAGMMIGSLPLTSIELSTTQSLPLDFSMMWAP